YRERFARDLAFSPRESGESRSYTILSRHTGVTERTRTFRSSFAVVEGEVNEGRRPSFAVSAGAKKSLQYVFTATFRKDDGSTFDISARSRRIGSPGVSNIRAARKEALNRLLARIGERFTKKANYSIEAGAEAVEKTSPKISEGVVYYTK
ncbi:MAG TPA: hypothetical protein VII92_14710, partial [Anaerolineae bacterium]